MLDELLHGADELGVHVVQLHQAVDDGQHLTLFHLNTRLIDRTGIIQSRYALDKLDRNSNKINSF